MGIRIGSNYMKSDQLFSRIQKRFYQSAVVNGWVVVIYESRFDDQDTQKMVQELSKACRDTGLYSLISNFYSPFSHTIIL